MTTAMALDMRGYNYHHTNGHAVSITSGFGEAANMLTQKLKTTIIHYNNATSRVSEEEKFNNLSVTWIIDTRLNSNPQAIAQHPAYRQIIGMGERAIPLIIKSMKDKPGHWFIALQSITGISPVRPEHRGDISAMTQDWLDWYDRQANSYN